MTDVVLPIWVLIVLAVVHSILTGLVLTFFVWLRARARLQRMRRTFHTDAGSQCASPDCRVFAPHTHVVVEGELQGERVKITYVDEGTFIDEEWWKRNFETLRVRPARDSDDFTKDGP
jgi:hypothetical protein